ncbi:hypothetical protein HYT51_03260 [Candidatus Woesearchaeota archaeon]|nr:hypothetical protein [Candidatus Woesearchaeota archaeon]
MKISKTGILTGLAALVFGGCTTKKDEAIQIPAGIWYAGEHKSHFSHIEGPKLVFDGHSRILDDLRKEGAIGSEEISLPAGRFISRRSTFLSRITSEISAWNETLVC